MSIVITSEMSPAELKLYLDNLRLQLKIKDMEIKELTESYSSHVNTIFDLRKQIGKLKNELKQK